LNLATYTVFIYTFLLLLHYGGDMGNLGMQELLLILIVALLVIGPKKLPELAKALGRALAEFRRATDDLKKDLDVENLLKDEAKKVQSALELEHPQDTPDSMKKGEEEEEEKNEHGKHELHG
jgi:TatA/E family protein of Tat protein translocase